MPVVDSYAICANALVAIINAEFASEQITAIHDDLHESLGTDGPIVGVSPLNQNPMSGNRTAQIDALQIQFFDYWEKEIDPTMEVDPRDITLKHARLKDAIRRAQVTTSDAFWFFQWEGTDFPRDPVGNKTRFVMRLSAWSSNSALTETSG